MYKHIELKPLVKYIKNKFSRGKDKISITILTWQDGDYFEEICDDDGGVIMEHLNFFKNKPAGKKINDINELILFLENCAKIPYIHSVNGHYKLFYDIYIWINNCIIIYNIYLKQCYYEKSKTLFDYIKYSLLHSAPMPKWINENQYKLELENYNNWYKKR